MAIVRPEFEHWNELIDDVQRIVISFISFTDLEYFSYTSEASRKLYSDSLPNRFRPEVIALLRDLGIGLPVPHNAFLTASKRKGKERTFVLKKDMATILRRLIHNCRFPFLAKELEDNLNFFKPGSLRTNFKDHYLIHQIHFFAASSIN